MEVILNILYHELEFWEELPTFSFHLSTPKQMETWGVIKMALDDKGFQQLAYGSWPVKYSFE